MYMDHVAILKKSKISKVDNLLQDILDNKNTIESRWYVNKIVPWDKVSLGDTIYFKESGGSVSIKAKVTKVIQYECLNKEIISSIIKKYGTQIAPNTSLGDFLVWGEKQTNKRYCILIFFNEVIKIENFEIDKTGFGISSAWITIKDINSIKKYK
jgi:hypothetical protein